MTSLQPVFDTVSIITPKAVNMITADPVALSHSTTKPTTAPQKFALLSTRHHSPATQASAQPNSSTISLLLAGSVTTLILAAGIIVYLLIRLYKRKRQAYRRLKVPSSSGEDEASSRVDVDPPFLTPAAAQTYINDLESRIQRLENRSSMRVSDPFHSESENGGTNIGGAHMFREHDALEPTETGVDGSIDERGRPPEYRSLEPAPRSGNGNEHIRIGEE